MVDHFLSGTSDEEAMLRYLDIKSVEELFGNIPQKVRTDLSKLPPGRSELDVLREMRQMLAKNADFEKRPHFLGAGAYHHYVPAAINPLILRGEFYTSYTPYQPEILQGMLQAMFEYQTYVTRLTEMEVANISMYDGPTALAEAAMMAVRSSRGKKVLLPANLHWEKKSIVKNYLAGLDVRIEEFAYDRATGEFDMADLEARLTPDTAAVLLQNPNFFGVWESKAPEVRALLDRKAPKALFVVDVNDPFSLGLARGPGAYGADVAVGEGAAIGNATAFGGPYLGLFATRWEHVRKMPGRIVGETTDSRGQRAYCLTFSTREQHIRRDKATSNICSNEALNALAFSIHLAMLGETGFRETAATCAVRAEKLRKAIGRTPFQGAHFHEFVVEAPAGAEARIQAAGLRGGYDLSRWHPELTNPMLVCVTEATPEWAMDKLAEVLS
ncbi:MAG TPA: aminomethyl-transferring glycine dehydrogenase subunit GcvPA [Candidatus Thermoplasmatota archaeon]|nr:aminomethyl-transferring glycine dehydrogenase subunit GcvPA [Candidatus Thermoplasmatota archaeon]